MIDADTKTRWRFDEIYLFPRIETSPHRCSDLRNFFQVELSSRVPSSVRLSNVDSNDLKIFFLCESIQDIRLHSKGCIQSGQLIATLKYIIDTILMADTQSDNWWRHYSIQFRRVWKGSRWVTHTVLADLFLVDVLWTVSVTIPDSWSEGCEFEVRFLTSILSEELFTPTWVWTAFQQAV